MAKARALVVLYLLMGALPAALFRKPKHVDVEHVLVSHPWRNCRTYLGEIDVSCLSLAVGGWGCRADLLFYKGLESMATMGAVHSV